VTVSDTANRAGSAATSRAAVYLLINLTFALYLAAGWVAHSQHEAQPLYLLALFALCSSPLLQWRRLNDRYMLLAAFAAVYFVFYGFQDALSLALPPRSPPTDTGLGSAAITPAEWVILVGGTLVLLGYQLATRGVGSSRSRGLATAPPADWPEGTLTRVGILLWAVTTALSWHFTVTILKAQTAQDVAEGLAKLGHFTASIYILANMLQPVSLLCLAYAQCRYRRRWMGWFLLAVVLTQLVIGFVEDIKGNALSGIVLVLVTRALIEGKLPRRWIIISAMGIMVLFPILQANRLVRSETGADRSQVARHLWTNVKLAVAASKQAKTQPDRPQTLLARMSLKGSVDLIVSETGIDVPFERGHTLSPLLTTFIPRFIWPNKPDVQTGQVMNHVFHISAVRFTYISPSHLGELFWNFGWTGVVFGMFAIGLLLGLIGSRFALAEGATLTRLLVLGVTIQLLILGAEGSIAVQYSVWVRSMAVIGLLHVLFARKPGLAQGANMLSTPGPRGESSAQRSLLSGDSPVFPNLMR
jgi:hypothetical protein